MISYEDIDVVYSEYFDNISNSNQKYKNSYFMIQLKLFVKFYQLVTKISMLIQLLKIIQFTKYQDFLV